MATSVFLLFVKMKVNHKMQSETTTLSFRTLVENCLRQPSEVLLPDENARQANLNHTKIPAEKESSAIRTEINLRVIEDFLKP
ncbi:MAG: hypothetical protein ACOYXC_13755 [Candidatus Rifleibacteriota bacterium]